MSSSVVTYGAPLTSPLLDLLACDAIVPGAEPSYQIAKAIWLYHPLGAKIVEAPVRMAQSQQREINIPKGPEERVREQFLLHWQKLGATKHIFNLAVLARVYGIASIAMLVDRVASDQPVDLTKIWEMDVSFNVFDPLNTSGSLVLNQVPTAMDFMKVRDIRVQGETYHRSRICVMMNEDPVYIAYTTSAFGFVGRSAYQRGLYPIKSFLSTIITDNLIAQKAGLIVAKMKQPGSIIDTVMQAAAAIKRNLLKEAQVGNVLSIQPEEDIESINLQNLEGPYTLARRNILENIAAADGMPAKLLLQETFAEGFGEGTEDAKYIAQYIEGFREWLKPAYEYFDKIVMYRAWNPEFYETIQRDFPSYKNIPFNQAFYEWRNSFVATWPSLIREPESEQIKVADVKLKAIIAMLEVLLPTLDPENKAIVLEWSADNFNELSELFDTPLDFDLDALQSGLQEIADREADQAMAALEEPKPGKPFAANDSEGNGTRTKRALAALDEAMGHLKQDVKIASKRAARGKNGAAAPH